MTGTAAQRWIDLHEARWSQIDRLTSSKSPSNTDIQAGNAVVQRMDPHRPHDAPLAAIASYVKPNDTVIDVGGGAGRVGLPLALQCRDVINVDPSPAMKLAFEECAEEAGIGNVRVVPEDWLEVEGIEGDMVLSIYMIEIVRDVARFIQKLEAAARRRVIITTSSIFPGNPHFPRVMSEISRELFGEAIERGPTIFELFPVLWEMGILPDVRVHRMSTIDYLFVGVQPPQSREEAIDAGTRWATRLNRDVEEQARTMVDARFDELFEQAPDGSWRSRGGGAIGGTMNDTLITWEARSAAA